MTQNKAETFLILKYGSLEAAVIEFCLNGARDFTFDEMRTITEYATKENLTAEMKIGPKAKSSREL